MQFQYTNWTTNETLNLRSSCVHTRATLKGFPSKVRLMAEQTLLTPQNKTMGYILLAKC